VSRRFRIVAIALCASSVYANGAYQPKTQDMQTFELVQMLTGGVAATAREWILAGNGRPEPVCRLDVGYSLRLDIASRDFYIDPSDLAEAVEILAQAQQPKADRIVKICKQWLDTGKRMDPAGDAVDVYNNWITKEPKLIPKHLRDLHALSVTMVQKPSFGTLEIMGNNTNGRNGYDYSPRAGFEGADQISFLVKLSNGKSVLLKYQMEYGYTGDTQKCYLKFGERQSGFDPQMLPAIALCKPYAKAQLIKSP
jgi:hypothetical protein